MADLTSCVFCDILAGNAPATIVRTWATAIAIKPLNPVTEGHTLIIPAAHVRDVAEDPEVSAMTMEAAAEYAAGVGPCNVITSAGSEATQTVFHLHLHVVPRRDGDGLALPWAPDAGRERAEQAERERAEFRVRADRAQAALNALTAEPPPLPDGTDDDAARQGYADRTIDQWRRYATHWRVRAERAEAALAALDGQEDAHDCDPPDHPARDDPREWLCPVCKAAWDRVEHSEDEGEIYETWYEKRSDSGADHA